MENILITGANGFVGHYLTGMLVRNGFRVIATGRGPSRLPFDAANYTYESFDFTDANAVHEILQRHQPGIIIHSGAMSAPDACEAEREKAFLVNVSGTANLLQNASELSAFFIYLSTDFVFDGKKGMYSEDDETGPVNYYGETKLKGEELVRDYSHEWTIVRTVLVYGKPLLNRQNLVTNTAISLKEKKPMKIFDDQVRTPTYVEDLAWAIMRLIQKRKTGIYHISGKDVITPYGMALATARYLSLDESLITKVEAHEFTQPAARPAKTGFNISKAVHELGYDPVSFEEGLRKTFKE